jgi:GH43 family beta-xylosidase
MENPWTLKGPQIMLTKPELDWEIEGFLVNEGPAVIKKNGRIFIGYSASATDHRYCMGLMHASEESDLLNPESWSKSDRPVFQSSGENGQYGPGHNCFTQSADGSEDIIVYHARNYMEIEGDPLYDPNRHTRAQKLKWKDDGMPEFGIPVPDGR